MKNRWCLVKGAVSNSFSNSEFFENAPCLKTPAANHFFSINEIDGVLYLKGAYSNAFIFTTDEVFRTLFIYIYDTHSKPIYDSDSFNRVVYNSLKTLTATDHYEFFNH